MKSLFALFVLSFVILCSLLAEVAYAKKVDLRPLQTPVKAQGDRDTCAYFAVSALIESTVKNFTGVEYDISEEYEIFRHKVLLPWRPEVEFGSTYELLNNFVHEMHFFREEHLPYQKSSPNFAKGLSPEELNFYDLRKRKTPYVQYRGLKPRVISQLWVKLPWSQLFKSELDQNRPVVVTLKLATAHINDLEGVVEYTPEIDAQCAQGLLACGGHAVLLVGYDDEKKQFLFKNSWGPRWGHEGYGFVTYEHVDNFSFDPLTVQFDKLIHPWVQPSQPK